MEEKELSNLNIVLDCRNAFELQNISLEHHHQQHTQQLLEIRSSIEYLFNSNKTKKCQYLTLSPPTAHADAIFIIHSAI